MSEFDDKARDWDKDEMHIQRSLAIAGGIENMIPLCFSMKALEYGAGTGILSFILKDRFSKITLMDNSREMIKICIEKTEFYKTKNIIPLWFDLEKRHFEGNFDILYNQMVLHHINDVEGIIKKFYSLLNPDGYLAIADLYPEDGSFHGVDVKVHRGFDPENLSGILRNTGFKNIKYTTCFEIKRGTGIKYPVFLLVAQKLTDPKV